MFENLTERLEGALKRIRGEHRISEENVNESLREVRRALLEADVNFQVVKDFIERVKVKALGTEVLKSLTPGQQIVKILHDELVVLMGSEKAEVTTATTGPTIILIAGLQGSGKTTFSAKLARHFKSLGRHPLLVAADIYRPAAINQLQALGQQIDIPVYASEIKDAVKIAEDARAHAREQARDVIIIDTAGRLSIDEQMMTEVANIKKSLNPTEILFVVDAMTGQDAVNTAKAFHDRLDFNGVVLTKLDGDTRGGAALSIRTVVEKPIKFVGTGEKMDALEPFYPDRMASRILGMGDVLTLAEKAQEEFDEEEAERLERKMRKAQFDLNDFHSQLKMLSKMGPLSSVMEMIPGINKMMRGQEVDERAFVRIEAMILSMTPQERSKPAIINGSRKKRIADGSGTSVQELNRFLKQFNDMQKMMKKLSKGGMRQFAQNLMGPQ
ncbi:MAG: signal recognition particle protein [Ectothiorhodospiraceae bacterium]|nr:signal recognition particle protein [Ectothiorhodospiraceae bacterium]